MQSNNPYLNDLVGLIIKRGMQLFLVMLIPGMATEALFYFITFSDETTFGIRRYKIIFMMLVFWILVGKDWFKKKKEVSQKMVVNLAFIINYISSL